MKNIFLVLFLSLSACSNAQEQTTRTVTLTWTDTANPAGTTYSVYKTTNPSAPLSAYVRVAQGITAKTYVDAGLIPGVYKYYVTAVFNTSESLPSNTADADAKPFSPILRAAEVTTPVAQ